MISRTEGTRRDLHCVSPPSGYNTKEQILGKLDPQQQTNLIGERGKDWVRVKKKRTMGWFFFFLTQMVWFKWLILFGK